MTARRTLLVCGLLFGWACAFGRAAEAQTVHVLLVGDTQNKQIGQSVLNDLHVMSMVFAAQIPRKQVQMRTLAEESFGRELPLRAIDDLRPGADDAVVFYWSGHGGNEEGKHFFFMPNGERLYRSEVIDRLTGKGARLAVLLSDACSNYVEPSLGRGPVAAAVAPLQRVTPLCDALFMRSKGLVDINSCKPGEFSYCNREGGFFTLALAHPGGQNRDAPAGFFWHNSQKEKTWADLAQETQATVNRFMDIAFEPGPQNIEARSLPELLPKPPKPPPPPPPAQVETMRVRPGDLLFWINGQSIDSYQDYWNAVKGSPDEMRFRVQRGPRIFHLTTRLRNGEGSRFGVWAEAGPGGGVVVTQVDPSPTSPGGNARLTRQTEAISLEPGDVILAINGQNLHSEDDFWRAVKSSPTPMSLAVRNRRDGQVVQLRAILRSGEGSRFGVVGKDNGGDGVRVNEVFPGFPGTRCEK